jgi:hypothetical protein
MSRQSRLAVLGWIALAVWVGGCGGGPAGGDVKLVDGGGIVKFRGSPLAGARVTFVPDKGPLASGTTDLEGKFKLSSGTMSGVAVGPCKVGVTALEGGGDARPSASMSVDSARAPANEEEAKKRLQAMNTMKEMQTSGTDSTTAGPKSVIPERYSNPESSTLTADVTTDPSKNQFTFELQP